MWELLTPIPHAEATVCPGKCSHLRAGVAVPGPAGLRGFGCFLVCDGSIPRPPGAEAPVDRESQWSEDLATVCDTPWPYGVLGIVVCEGKTSCYCALSSRRTLGSVVV